jgi:hypothetical protein
MGPPTVTGGAPASATVSGMWQCGQTVSPLMYHVQQLRQTARLTRDPQETQRSVFANPASTGLKQNSPPERWRAAQ